MLLVGIQFQDSLLDIRLPIRDLKIGEELFCLSQPFLFAYISLSGGGSYKTSPFQNSMSISITFSDYIYATLLLKCPRYNFPAILGISDRV